MPRCAPALIGVQFLLANAPDVSLVSLRRHRLMTRRIVISLVQAQMLRSFIRVETPHHNTLQGHIQQLGVVNVGSGHHHAQRPRCRQAERFACCLPCLGPWDCGRPNLPKTGPAHVAPELVEGRQLAIPIPRLPVPRTPRPTQPRYAPEHQAPSGAGRYGGWCFRLPVPRTGDSNGGHIGMVPAAPTPVVKS